MAGVSWSNILHATAKINNGLTINCQLTMITHFGIISLLSYIAVLLTFLDRYSSSDHRPTSLSSAQNFLYSLYRFSSLAGCGLQWPRRKSGGLWITHGAHKQCGQWSSPRRTGRWWLFLYPTGWLGWLTNNKHSRPALILRANVQKSFWFTYRCCFWFWH